MLLNHIMSLLNPLSKNYKYIDRIKCGIPQFG